MDDEQKWQSKITYSPKALKYYIELCKEFGSLDDSINIPNESCDGSDLAYEIFDILAAEEQWTFFWTGDQYVFFVCSERELLQELRRVEKELKADEESEEEVVTTPGEKSK